MMKNVIYINLKALLVSKDVRTMPIASNVFIVNFEHISHLVPVFLYLALNMQSPAGYDLRI